MEAIHPKLLSSATLAFEGLAELVQHNNIDKIIPLRSHITEFLFMNFLNISDSYKIDICYHGTKADANGIETYGMFDPVSDNYKVKNGNAYGKGIYVSSSRSYSINYSVGGILIVMLVIKGVEAGQSQLVYGSVDLQADSQTISNITVLRSTCQVLPVFAVSHEFLIKNSDFRSKSAKNSCDFPRGSHHVNDLLMKLPKDSPLINTAELLKSEFPNVKFGVIHQLLVRESIKLHNCDNYLGIIYEKVNKMLTELNYEDY